MGIRNSAAFYDHLLRHADVMKAFYHFSTLTGLCQYERLFKYVGNIANKQLRILDWGCGNGWFSYYLYQQGFSNVISYGYGWDAIDAARKFLPRLEYVDGERAELSNPSELPFPDESFDFVFSVGVLEHVHETGGDQLLSMREISRVLRSGGRFFCYHLPNRYTWIEFIKGLFATSKSTFYLHTRKFDGRAIRDLATKSGLTIEKIGRYNLLPYNIHRSTSFDGRIPAALYTFLDNALLITPLGHLAQCYMFEATKQENA